MPETDITDYYASVSWVGMDLAEVSLSQARHVGAEPVADLEAESLIRYFDDEAQFRLTGMWRDDFGFEIAALEERGAIRCVRLVWDRFGPGPRPAAPRDSDPRIRAVPVILRASNPRRANAERGSHLTGRD